MKKAISILLICAGLGYSNTATWANRVAIVGGATTVVVNLHTIIGWSKKAVKKAKKVVHK